MIEKKHTAVDIKEYEFTKRMFHHTLKNKEVGGGVYTLGTLGRSANNASLLRFKNKYTKQVG